LGNGWIPTVRGNSRGKKEYIFITPDFKTDIATFIHIVDSRVPDDPLSVQDEGVFHPLDNCDELETGSMVNPETQRKMHYQEIWRTLPVSGKGFILLESIDDKDKKTFLGRIGEYFQGIGISNGTIHAKRCINTYGSWREIFTFGDPNFIPVVIEQDDWKIDDKVEFAGRLWRVLSREAKSF